MDVSKQLGAKAYVLWGGREGYNTLWNTNLRHELDTLAVFMKLVAAYNKKIGLGQLLLEPKPQVCCVWGGSPTQIHTTPCI